MILRIGTRKSLLAKAQTLQIAKLLESTHAALGLKTELIGIETRGDQLLDVPLSEVEGKEFFVAELDEALRAGKVDFTVHSLKDLSLQRPTDFVCAAIPKREMPQDIIVWNFKKNRSVNYPLKVGTSAPRRLENLPHFLEKALPPQVSKDGIGFVSIRGNVNTRLSRLTLDPEDPRALDGVVLAIAGLNRLCLDPNAFHEIRSTLLKLENLKLSLLPLSVCPSAPGQGALALECRAEDHKVFSLLRALHHPETQREIELERDILAEWGGGCHQPVGASAIVHPEFKDPLLFVCGNKKGVRVEELRWTPPTAFDLPSANSKNIWDGMENTAHKRTPVILPKNFCPKGLLITHSKIADALEQFTLSDTVNTPTEESPPVQTPWIFTSGISSWKKSAQKGLWVTGCLEGFGEGGFGERDFATILLSPFLKAAGIPIVDDWVVLTHRIAAQERPWKKMKTLGCYEVEYSSAQYQTESIQNSLTNADFLFWGSGTQYAQLHKFAKQNARHFCGPGRTAEYLRQQGQSPVIFPSREEWTQWIKRQMKTQN